MRLRILDIDGSLPSQPGIAAALAEGRAQRVDLRDEERALRLWTSRRRLRRLAGRLDALDEPDARGPLVTFYGSGDYHHIATVLMAPTVEPFSVVHFDNHPDWVRMPATHNCGGWVNRALELPLLKRIVTLGPCSDDLVRPQLKSGNILALASGRLEIHAWRAQPSRVWGRVGDGAGHQRRGHHLFWHCLADQEWPTFLEGLVARLPTEALWVSIDKDVLRPADASTNWDQGEMPLDALVVALKRLAVYRRIVGVDVCGEYSEPRFRNPLKLFAARFDHPRTVNALPDALARNDLTNRALIATLTEILP